jgi:hypothetical protein
MIQTKKLTLAELKANSANSKVIANIEAIRGGADEEYCHNGKGKPLQDNRQGVSLQEFHRMVDDFMRSIGL